MSRSKLFGSIVPQQRGERHLFSNTNCITLQYSGMRTNWTLQWLSHTLLRWLLPHTAANYLSTFHGEGAESPLVFRSCLYIAIRVRTFCFNILTDESGHISKCCSSKVNWSAGRFCTSLSSDAFMNLNESNSLIYSDWLVHTPFWFELSLRERLSAKKWISLSCLVQPK